MGSQDTEGVLTPVAQTVWKVLLLVAGISLASIEAYRLSRSEKAPDPGDLPKVVAALQLDQDAQNRTLAELQEKIRSLNIINSKEHDKIMEQIALISERQTQIREKLAIIESKLAQKNKP